MTRARGSTSTVRAIGDGKGYIGRRKNCLKTRKDAVRKAGQYAYVGRKVKKHEYRALWIQRINAAVRPYGINYSTFINLLYKSEEAKASNGVESKFVINRKSLSEAAINHKAFFESLVLGLLKQFNYS